MMFEDRIDAGKQLTKVLQEYKNREDTIVVALPRGGVVTGAVIAKDLNLPLDIIVPRKIGSEFNPEFAVGAITETGGVVWDMISKQNETDEYLQKKIEEEKAEAKRRLKLYRGSKSPRNLKNKTILLVDDGVATGLTMKAAIKSAQNETPKEIIVVVPHGAKESLDSIRTMVTKVIALAEPVYYEAVGLYYNKFNQTKDEEVIQIMKEV